MNRDALVALMDLAEERGAPLIDSWGTTALRIDDGIDTNLLTRVMGITGLTVTAYFGDELHELVLDDQVPDTEQVTRLLPLAPNERVGGELRTARSTEIARMLVGDLVALRVAFERPGWIRTAEAFFSELERDWLQLAESLTGVIKVGDWSFALERLGRGGTPSRPSVYVPAEPEPSDGRVEVWRELERLADASSWVNLAQSVRRVGNVVEIGLIRDELPRREVHPRNSKGAADLFRWVVATDDPNRREALDYVLMLVSAGSAGTVPSGTTVQRLAERERIALTSKQAAEVQRAIAEGQRDASEALARASSEVGSLVEETTKNANAALLAVLGLVLLVAREPGKLPTWLVTLATLAAVLGISLVVASRWTRLGDHQRSIEHVVTRLKQDPLLPEDDRAAALAVIMEFNVQRRVARARRFVVELGAVAMGVAVAAAVWLGSLSPESTETEEAATPSPQEKPSVVRPRPTRSRP